MTFSEITQLPIGIGSATVGDLFSAIVTLLVCLLVIRILGRISAKLLSTTKLDLRVQRYVVRGIKLVAWIITVILVFESLNIHATSLVALLSVGSLGLTLAAEDILGNVAGGLVILSSRPFATGDFIEADSVSGTVDEITLNHTKLINPDGQVVFLPNKTLAATKLTNYTSLGRRRIARKVSVSYDAPTDTVKAACQAALDRTERLLADPAPSVYLSSYGSSSIEYAVYCWARPEDYWDAYFALGENLRAAFSAAGVEMTYDHLNVHLVEDRTRP